MSGRLILTVPLLVVGSVICSWDYSVVWRYFFWSNQTLAMIVLWTIAVYLRKNQKKDIYAMIPAVFMTAVTSTYFFAMPECMGIQWNVLGLAEKIYYPVSVAIGVALAMAELEFYLRCVRK